MTDDTKQTGLLFILFIIGVILSVLVAIEKRNEALLDLLVKRSPTCYETSR